MERTITTVPDDVKSLGEEIKRPVFALSECVGKARASVPSDKSKQEALGDREDAFDQILGDMLLRVPEVAQHVDALKQAPVIVEFAQTTEGAVSEKGKRGKTGGYGKQQAPTPHKIKLTTKQKKSLESDEVVDKPIADIVDDLIFEVGNIIAFEKFNVLDDEFLKARGTMSLRAFGEAKAAVETKETTVKHAQLVERLVAKKVDVGAKGLKTLTAFQERYRELLRGEDGPEATRQVAELCEASHEPALIPTDKSNLADPAMKVTTWLSSIELSFYDKIVEMNAQACINCIFVELKPLLAKMGVLDRRSYPEKAEAEWKAKLLKDPSCMKFKSNDLVDMYNECETELKGWVSESIAACTQDSGKPFVFLKVVTVFQSKFKIELKGCAFSSDMTKVAQANKNFDPAEPAILLRPVFDGNGDFIG